MHNLKQSKDKSKDNTEEQIMQVSIIKMGRLNKKKVNDNVKNKLSEIKKHVTATTPYLLTKYHNIQERDESVY